MTVLAVTEANPVPGWRRWVLACGGGETLGMAAAATAAGLTLAAVGEPHDLPSAAVTVVGMVAGGVVEGLAVGWLQFLVLRRWLPRLRARAWVGVTVAVAAGGWLLGSLPATLGSLAADGDRGGDAAATGPPTWLMPIAGLVVGLLMGAVFGWAQARVLRGHVPRPRRWVLANALGWGAALVVIFTGASLPSGPWPWPLLLALGAVTGVLAGVAIGSVTGLFLPSLVDQAPPGGTRVNRIVLFCLRSPAHRLLSGSLADLRYTGARSGRRYALPVQYARDGDRVVVYPGHPKRKVWWRSMVVGAPVEVGLAGETTQGQGRVLRPNEPGYPDALAAYRCRWPRVAPGTDDPLVVIELAVADDAHERGAQGDPRVRDVLHDPQAD